MSRPERIQATDTEKTGTPQFGSVAEDAVTVSLRMGSEGPTFPGKSPNFPRYVPTNFLQYLSEDPNQRRPRQ